MMKKIKFIDKSGDVNDTINCCDSVPPLYNDDKQHGMIL